MKLATTQVMTFNIRYGTADDGANSWPLRRELVCETIRKNAPDLLGLQEALDFQVEYIDEQLAQYGYVGVGRNDGRRAGEFSPLFFRSDRFALVASGHYWLSESPEEPGSVSWDASQTRIVSWARLRDREGSEQELLAFNTHFDQRSEQARRESARLLRQRIDSIAGGVPVILTGDFNATEDDLPYRLLLDEDGTQPPLIDAYRAVHTERCRDELSRHGFQPLTVGSRIDWILHSRHFRPIAAEIVRTEFDGRYPSDHYPVTAELQFDESVSLERDVR